MNEPTSQGQKIIDQLAERYGVSNTAVTTLLRAVAAGHGTMAQFNHPDLGGQGQWSQGGMIMIGDMFNHSLKAKVDALCSELADLLQHDESVFAAVQDVSAKGEPGGGTSAREWWGSDLGSAAATGSQNHMRYAYFPGSRRLAVSTGDRVTIYDTGDHQIHGVAQQQSGDSSLTFGSQLGKVSLDQLRQVSGESAEAPHRQPTSQAEPAAKAPDPARGSETSASSDDVFGKLERLSQLHDKGIISAEEYASKKAELLARL